MKPQRRTFDIFSLSFLDVVSCGFGAVILLVLISDFSEAVTPQLQARTEALLRAILGAEAEADDLRADLSDRQAEAAARAAALARLRAAAEAARGSVRTSKDENRVLDKNLAGLTLVEQSVKRAAVQQDTTQESDEEVGGIPVDSDYVVFIVDTSGSMQQIWGRVTRELENVMTIHPKITGFQILNDNGAHLISGYAGRWIPDTPRRRQNVIRLFRTWNSTSNSSPVEGLHVALRRYARPNIKLSIYIFGDDYTGGSYDPVIEALHRLNTDAATGKRLAKVHAVGFVSPHTQGHFPILMRELTRQNGGTFVALPVQ
ncbi:MAG: VWA domain-containing protein [Desulfurellaceae bacterium]|nr:VWA domain-containing protein [Desulfurellaceae bacterium]